MCFQNLAELWISLFYAIGVIITACHKTGNTAKLSCKFTILQWLSVCDWEGKDAKSLQTNILEMLKYMLL